MKPTMTWKHLLAGAAFATVLSAGAALAQQPTVTIGITLSTTGPAAALGVPERNALAFWPEEIGGAKIKQIVLDDAGDPTAATTNARRFVTEDKVDVLAGSSTTPPTIAVGNVAAEAKVPHLALAPMPVAGGRETWSVVLPQPVPLMAGVIFDHMKINNIKTIALIGFSDSWGDLWAKEYKDQGEPGGLKLVADERFARTDTSVTGQVLKIVAAKPDAVLVAASGTAAALPNLALRERGYKGPIYQTHGAVTYDFIRIAGKSAEGTIFASGPVMVAEQQPDSALTKKPGVTFVTQYEGKYGPETRTQFGAHSFDAAEVLKRVIPVALKVAKPGTQEFRDAIRDAFTTERNIAAAQAVYNFTKADRYGVDDRARVLMTVKDGKFVLVK